MEVGISIKKIDSV